jgi:pyruvate dehydrogenase E1 component beta subunit
MRPVVELMHIDFIGVCFDQVLNQAAKMRYMFGGQAKVPMVIRTTIGAGASAAAHHSQNLYSLFVHIPGLKVVLPSTPYDAKGLLLTSIRDDDPVIYIENKLLYTEKGPVPEEEYTIPLGKARVVREGKDVTVVALSRMVYLATEAAGELARDGIEIEIIDPRTLFPLDEEAILWSVEKTGRLVIYDEDTPRCSMAADIAALVADRGFHSLDAPIKMVTAPHSPVPFSPHLEKGYVPDSTKLIATVKGMV